MPIRPDTLLTASDTVRLDKIFGLLDRGPAEAPEAAAIRLLSADTPILMFPVRLEARFATDAPVLKVRVYPDDVHQDGLQRSLTQKEIDAGRAYWAELSAGADPAGPAWSALVGVCGPAGKGLHRAGWVSRRTAGDADPGVPRDEEKVEPLTARALPARWLAVGFAGGREVARQWSADVRRPLLLGPETRKGTIDPERIFADPATAWIADYEQAVAAGMAINLRLPAGIASLDLLLVVGVRDGEPGEAATELAELLQAHRFRWGVELLAPGTPTNTTVEAASAWTSRPDEAAAAPVARQTPAPGTDLAALLSALGLAADTDLAAVPGAGRTDQQHQRDMNAALWATTWGGFLETLLDEQTGEDGIPRRVVRAVRSLFVDNVRAGGPLPALRIGRQPYGVLPATAFGSWQPAPGEGAELGTIATVLGRLRPFWVEVARSSPRVLPSAALPDTTVAEILGQGPWPDPRGYRARTVLGPTFCRTHGIFVDGTNGRGWALGAGLGLEYIPLIADAQIMPGNGAVLAVPPVVAPAADGTPPRLTASEYLRLLAGLTPDELAADPPPGIGDPAPPDLLYQLARRSLLDAADAAGLITAKAAGDSGVGGRFTKATLDQVRRVEMTGGAVPTARELLTMRFSDVVEVHGAGLTAVAAATFRESTVGAVLASGISPVDLAGTFLEELFSNDAPAWFRDARQAVARLAAADLTPADLTRLLGGTLSLADNRLDAWITGLATRRLAARRSAVPNGVHLGGYGWLIDLRTEERVAFEPPVPGEKGPLWNVLGDGGAILAPSMAHAATAAVLRAAELTHRDAGEQATVARLDVTSASVRAGRWVLDAVAAGQSAAAVVGYRFERLLHEAKLDQYIDDVRAKFPLHGGQAKDDAAAGAVEAVAPRDVVDGVSLWDHWQTSHEPPIPVEGADRAAMDTVLADLDATVEAVSDLLVAEGVHQLVAGSAERAAATLTGIGRGDPVPSDPAVARTPRRGLPVNARVAVLLPGEPTPAAGWNTNRMRARVDPRVEGWAAAMLGDPARWTFAVPLADGGAAPVRLDSLGLCALDVICESALLGAGTSLLETRVRVAAGAGTTPLSTAPTPDGALGWAELVAVAGRLRTVLLAARPLTRRDLFGAVKGEDVVGAAGLDDLAARLAPAAEALRELDTDLRTALPAGTDPAVDPLPDPVTLAGFLGRAAELGLPGSVVLPGADLTSAAHGLATTVAAAAGVAATLLATAGHAAAGDGHPRLEQTRLDAMRDLARACLGPAMAVAPLLAPVPSWPDAVATAGRTPDGTPPDLADWLADAAAVRTATDALAWARLACGAIGGDGSLVAAQFPPGPTDVWLGGKLARDADGLPRPPSGPRTTLVGHVTHPVDAATGLAGLLVDDWTEVLPASDEVVGVAVNVNAPGARPPQSLLLAVAPDPSRTQWTVDDVLATVAETLDLARIRTVHRAQLAGLSRYLPAIYVREGLDGVPAIRRLVKSGIRDLDATKAYPLG